MRGVIQGLVRHPQGPVMKVGRRLGIVCRFLVAGSRLFTKAASHVGEGLPHGLQTGRFNF